VVWTLALALPAQADARDYKWRVSGSITGTYSNSVSAYSCFETKTVATFAEQLRLNVKLVPRYVSSWSPGQNFGAVFRLAAGGDWHVTGTFPPRHVDQVTGEASCGPPEKLDCIGRVELMRRNGAGNEAAFSVDPIGRTMRGQFLYFRGFAESAVLRALPGPEICNPYRASDEQRAGPLWGLGSTGIGSDTYAERILSFPVSKLKGRKPFTVTLRPAKPKPDECAAEYWISCTQSGSLAMRLRFARVATGGSRG
jgi:hypothetical protein